MANSSNLRRSTRIKTRAPVNNPEQITSVGSSDEEELMSHNMRKMELETIEENVQKPIELFCNDDVSGEKLYSFDSSHKKKCMIQKASMCHTPRTPKMPKLNSTPVIVLEKIAIDDINKKSLNGNNKNPRARGTMPIMKRYTSGMTSSESESISESDEYMPSDETDDDIHEESLESENSISSDDATNKIQSGGSKQKYIRQSKLLDTPRRISGRNKPTIAYKDVCMKSDEYFETQLEKAVTSDRTLARLHNSRLTKERLEELLSDQNHVPAWHKKYICSLNQGYTSLFHMWNFIMEEGYTVLLHGLGSKRCLINDFHKSIANHPSLVVNGFFPSLALKDILDGIMENLLGLSCPTNTSECLDLIAQVLKENPEDRLYLLIHNIDGVVLRSNKAQDLLSCLASIPNLFVLASLDHINAPLLWDDVRRSKFNFFWWDTSTFLPYQEETSYESSLLVQQSGTLALSSLRNVFLSLTSNSKSIYILLANYQLKNSGTANFTGMAFKDLYRAAREGFFVSSDVALRAQLTEFIDHKLAKSKRNMDGVEYLTIPLSNELLKKFLEEHES